MNNLIDILQNRAKETPEQIAYIFLQDGENQEEKITYQNLWQKSLTIGHKLQSLLPANSTALLVYPQGLDFIVAFLACLSARIIPVPAYPPKRN